MMMEWPILSAQDYCDRVTDGTHDSPKASENGMFLITSKNLGAYEINYSNCYKISNEDYNKIIKRSAVEQWDVLISMIGTIGLLYIERNKMIPYACKNVGIFKLNGDEAKAKWLYYYLQSPMAKEYINANLRGTTQMYLPLEAIRKMPILNPNDTIKHKIVAVLSAIDDKIQLNNQTIINLENFCESIYKLWFVDKKIFQDRQFCWKKCALKDISKEIICGKTPSTKINSYYNGPVPFITIPDMHSQLYVINTERTLSISGADSQKNKYLPKNSVCVSCIGTVGIVCLVDKVSQTNQQINTIVPIREIDSYYLYFVAKSLKDKIISLGQCGSTIANLNKEQFAKLDVLKIDDQSLADFGNFVKPYFDKILALQYENKNLEDFRDVLLPKIMSGEIDASNVEVK